MLELPEGLKKVVDVAPETDEKILALAKKENAVFLSMIAPYSRVRISPVEDAHANIGLSEEFGIEEAIREIKTLAPRCEKLCLLINSPGGFVSSSYKIAKFLRGEFKTINVYVPHLAASGGTLIALIGDEIILGPMSQLGPLDAQVQYEDGRLVSTTSLFRSFSRLNEYFKDKLREEAPYPWAALADSLDPVLMEDWNGSLTMIQNYAVDILTKAGYPQADAARIAQILVWELPSHEFVIDFARAKEMGLKVKLNTDCKEWSEVRNWFASHVTKAADKHIIRYAVNPVGDANDGMAESPAGPSRAAGVVGVSKQPFSEGALRR